MKFKYLILLTFTLQSILCIGQNNSVNMELKIKDFKLEGNNNYDHAAEGKTVVQNLLLQSFLNNQMGRSQEFFNDMHKHGIKELKSLGYSFYWPNDINMDFSMREIDEHNSNILREIVATYGFPSFEELNELELKSIFLILYYSNDIDLIEKYKENFLEYYRDFNFPSKYYAYLTDKLDYITSKQQTYGTFLILDENGSKQPQMIKNESQLDERRLKIGLENYEKWKQSKDYKKIGERTRLRESWYRDYYNKTRNPTDNK